MRNVPAAVKKLGMITAEMTRSRKHSKKLSEERRTLMYRLNREDGITYKELSTAAQINESRVFVEMKKARAEAGESVDF